MRVIKEAELRVPAPDVWLALVKPDERRQWYYRLAPAGEWRAGGHLQWRGGDGSVAEESTVLQVDPGRRLSLQTHFLFTPSLAAEPPHNVTWELQPTDGGCRVRMVADFSAAGPAAKLLESEGDAILQGLRLELDPVARTELARLEQIGDVEVVDLTPSLRDEYLRFFDQDAFRDYPAWQGCYCLETHWPGSDDEWMARTAADNRATMAEMVAAGEVTALLAFADGKPVGWCNYGETTRLHGVLRRFDLNAPEQAGVGSIACFVVGTPYRGHGVARQLLDTACDRLTSRGLRWAEAYPRREPDSAQAAYRGPLEMYLHAGFRLYREAGPTLVVRKALV